MELDDNTTKSPHGVSCVIAPIYYEWGNVTIQNENERFTLDVPEDVTAFEVWNLIKFIEEAKMNPRKDAEEQLIIRVRELNLERLFRIDTI